jgi:short-subunit dehydrogenase
VELRGTVAVMTGASSGFGELTALALAREGANVVLGARRVERLEALAERIRGRGGRALPVRCDVSRVADIEALRDRVSKEFGRCDVLVNNAGVPGGGAFSDVSLEIIERVTRVNYLGVVYSTKAFLPMMLGQARGHIVNVASLAGRFAIPGATLYTASKHAVVAFSESLYYELAPFGILVTVVNPGLAPTEGFPQTSLPRGIVMKPQRIAETIVAVIEKGKAPEVCVPRFVSTLQAFRVLTPPLYRWGVRMASRGVGAARRK